ncbi:MAG: metal-dependent transcriptional regulator [Firmicutes bacterium]|nr:metal-dependent transcriptional regulator [Candidatus Fiminaster equi]
MKLSQSFEDYLEAIYVLEISDQKIKSVTISRMLDVSKPAVTKAMNELFDANYIEKTPYSQIKLTKSGRQIAKNVYHRHTVIRNFLINKLGVSQEIAEKDCCMIEHVISPETLRAMENN